MTYLNQKSIMQITTSAVAVGLISLMSCDESDYPDRGPAVEWNGDWSPSAQWGVEGEETEEKQLDDGASGSKSGSAGNTNTNAAPSNDQYSAQQSDYSGVDYDNEEMNYPVLYDTDSSEYSYSTDTMNAEDAGVRDGGLPFDFGDGGVDGGPKLAKRQKSIPKPKTLFLSADDSNSQSSPVLIRSIIESGSDTIPLDRLRIWEFFNYYNFEYPGPGENLPLSVHQQLRPYNIEGGTYALQVGVQARRITQESRRPLNITLVLDTSGSMGGSPIELLKETCKAIASSLKAGDKISMVTWSTTQEIPIETLAVEGPNDPQLVATINGISSGGGTDLHAGLSRGYQLARDNFMTDGLNRVVLISDGGANAGITDEEIIAGAAEGAEGEAIFLVGVGVGDSNYNDTLMDTVTDWGKGASIYIDSTEEAKKMFASDRFLSNMEVAALDVRVEMTLPPFFDIDKFYGEEYSTVAAEIEPQHLAPNDAMIYQQLIKTKEPTLVAASDVISLKVTYTDALTGQEAETSTSTTMQELVDGPFAALQKGDAIVAYTQTLGAVEKARRRADPAAASSECENGIVILSNAAVALQDSDLEEMQTLLELFCSASL